MLWKIGFCIRAAWLHLCIVVAFFWYGRVHMGLTVMDMMWPILFGAAVGVITYSPNRRRNRKIINGLKERSDTLDQRIERLNNRRDRFQELTEEHDDNKPDLG